MIKKYEYAVNAISVANGVDVNVAFDMLKTNLTRGGTYPYVKVDEFMADVDELSKLALEDLQK